MLRKSARVPRWHQTRETLTLARRKCQGSYRPVTPCQHRRLCHRCCSVTAPSREQCPRRTFPPWLCQRRHMMHRKQQHRWICSCSHKKGCASAPHEKRAARTPVQVSLHDARRHSTWVHAEGNGFLASLSLCASPSPTWAQLVKDKRPH